METVAKSEKITTINKKNSIVYGWFSLSEKSSILNTINIINGSLNIFYNKLIVRHKSNIYIYIYITNKLNLKIDQYELYSRHLRQKCVEAMEEALKWCVAEEIGNG
jgi:hypothetical protein